MPSRVLDSYDQRLAELGFVHKIANGQAARKTSLNRVRKYQGDLCAACMKRCCGKHGWLTAHHIKPKREGGLSVFGNLVGLCRPCHDNEEVLISKQLGHDAEYWVQCRERCHRIAVRGHA